jgi:hypothetical protein
MQRDLRVPFGRNLARRVFARTGGASRRGCLSSSMVRASSSTPSAT